MTNKRIPHYNDKADYNTNSPSYYHDLARKNKLIKLLAEKIWEYDERLDQRINDLEEVLSSYLSQWDERIENLNDEVSHIFVTWLNDGTLEQIINHDVLGNKADQSELDKTNAQLAQIATNVKDFGVVGDGVTDDTNALKTFTSQLQRGDKVLFPSGYRFNVSDTITFPTGVSIIMESPLVYTGLENIPILVVGEKGNDNSNIELVLMAEKETMSDWSNEHSVAIRIYNLYTSKLTIRKTLNTTIGTEMIGSGRGFVYNTIFLFHMYSHKKTLVLTNERYDGRIGWINENLFIGGRFSQFLNTKLGESRYGVVITSKDESYGNNNNNNFIKPSFEMGVADAENGGGEAVPVVIEYGSQNEFINARHEGNSNTFMRTLNQSDSNSATLGYGNGVLDNQSNRASNFVENRFSTNTPKWVSVFNSGFLPLKAKEDGENVSFDEMSVFGSSRSDPRDELNNILITDDHVDFASTRGVGVKLHTDKVKKFLVTRDETLNKSGRVAVIAYNNEGVKVTDNSKIKGRSGITLAYTNIFGGAYVIGTNTSDRVLFELASEIAYVYVIAYGAELRQFSISAYENIVGVSKS